MTRQERCKRQEIAKVLYGMGFTLNEVARVLGWDRQTILKDVREFQRSHYHRSRAVHAVLSSTMTFYANIVEGSMEDMTTTTSLHQRISLREVLQERLRENEILSLLEGAEITLKQLSAPQYNPQQEGYANLLKAIFGEEVVDRGDAVESHHEFWRECLREILIGQFPIPKSWDDLKGCLIALFIKKHRDLVMPIWPVETIKSEIHRALAGLRPRTQVVVCLRYGLNSGAVRDEAKAKFEEFTKSGRSPVLREIGEFFGVSRTRIEQVEKEGLRRLRRFDVRETLAPFVFSSERLLKEVVVNRISRKIEAGMKERVRDVPSLAILQESNSLPISVRAANCLNKARILLVGELVQKNEYDLLRISGFVSKCLREVKEALAETQLGLDMHLTEEMKETIKQMRDDIVIVED